MPDKPVWPYPNIVRMYAHRTNRWAKKIKGKTHYFGHVDDPDEALRLYQKIGPDLHAGRTPRPAAMGAVTVADALNAFLSYQADRVQAGELRPNTWRDYAAAAKLVTTSVGRSTAVADLRPADFQKIRNAASSRYGTHLTGKTVTIVKTMFRWAHENEVADALPRFGTAFRKPAARQYRQQRASRRPLTPADAHALLQVATVPMRAMILLGLNMGYGNNDCASLMESHIDRDAGMVVFPRPKTGIQRAGALWPETLEAIDAAIAARPIRRADVPAGLVFITKTGQQWVRERVSETDSGKLKGVTPVNAVSAEFAKLARKAGVQGGGFYDLRHTFRTVADAAGDQHAVHRIMGHSLPGMADVYVHDVEADRIRAVTDYVRRWLFE